MFNKIKAAYGAGYRAGRVEPKKIVVTDRAGRDTSYLLFPQNPFTKRPLRSFFWFEGYYVGQLERLRTPARSYAHG